MQAQTQSFVIGQIVRWADPNQEPGAYYDAIVQSHPDLDGYIAVMIRPNDVEGGFWYRPSVVWAEPGSLSIPYGFTS